MAYQQLQIKDIFIGSIDAKDDFQRNRKEFIENFLVPSNFEIEDFYNGNKFIVEGYKGTGKTALLNYIRNEVNINHISSFILFKSEYNSIDRNVLEKISSNIIEIDKDKFIDEMDFEYVWRWIFLSKMIDFNIENSYDIFKKNKKWDKFEKVMRELSMTKSKNKTIGSFFSKLKTNFTIAIPSDDIIYSLGLEMKDNKEFNFIEILDSAFDLYLKLERTSKEVYIFIDELETYYVEKNIFFRDLRLIRDMIFTVKFFNDFEMTNRSENPIHYICAVRTEILDSISKNVSGKELNKITYSHRQELKWIYNQQKGYKHPIIQIWIKRIKSAEYKLNKKKYSDKEIMENWFPSNLHSVDIVSYILHNTWYKPRDIVRFMQSAKNCDKDKLQYDQQILVELKKEYSKESWKEVVEELNAKYTSEEISHIKQFLLAFKDRFSFDEAVERADKITTLLGSDFISKNLVEVLKDLYRVGVLGNVSLDRKYFRWHHKGDQDLLINDGRHLFEVHNALRNVLSIYFVNQLKEIDVVVKEGRIARVTGATKTRVNVSIDGSTMKGYITKHNMFSKNPGIDLLSSVRTNQKIYVEVLSVTKQHKVSLKKITAKKYEELALKKKIQDLKKHINKK